MKYRMAPTSAKPRSALCTVLGSESLAENRYCDSVVAARPVGRLDGAVGDAGVDDDDDEGGGCSLARLAFSVSLVASCFSPSWYAAMASLIRPAPVDAIHIRSGCRLNWRWCARGVGVGWGFKDAEFQKERNVLCTHPVPRALLRGSRTPWCTDDSARLRCLRHPASHGCFPVAVVRPT